MEKIYVKCSWQWEGKEVFGTEVCYILHGTRSLYHIVRPWNQEFIVNFTRTLQERYANIESTPVRCKASLTSVGADVTQYLPWSNP